MGLQLGSFLFLCIYLFVKQVDVLPSKNQVLCDLIYNIINGKSRELRFVTKEHIAMHKNLIPLFKLPLLFTVKRKANTALRCSSSIVSHNALRY